MTSLRMAFTTATARKLFITMDHVKSAITGAEVAAYMQLLIDNSEFFALPPVEVIGAEVITRADLDLA